MKKQSLACVAGIARYCLVIAANIGNLITLYFHQSIMSIRLDIIFYASLFLISLYIKNVSKFDSFFSLEHLEAHEKPPRMLFWFTYTKNKNKKNHFNKCTLLKAKC